MLTALERPTPAQSPVTTKTDTKNYISTQDKSFSQMFMESGRRIVSSGLWPGSKLNGARPTMSVIGWKDPGGRNSKVVPRVSPAASKDKRVETFFVKGHWSGRFAAGSVWQRNLAPYRFIQALPGIEWIVAVFDIHTITSDYSL
ncbi:MAG: hypothetical protein WBG50_11675 [Desulfomonilaceae bacterium]